MRLRGGPPTFPHAICENISPVEWLSQFIAPKCWTTTSASALNSAFSHLAPDAHFNQLQRPGNLHYRLSGWRKSFSLLLVANGLQNYRPMPRSQEAPRFSKTNELLRVAQSTPIADTKSH